MPTIYTKISKPTGTSYMNVNPQGREQYDQSSISYDDANVFYDGINYDQWTDVAKPAGGVQTTIRAGMATGLLMPLTYSRSYVITSDSWTRVTKPN